jgi:hypothetical protein
MLAPRQSDADNSSWLAIQVRPAAEQMLRSQGFACEPYLTVVATDQLALVNNDGLSKFYD